MTAANGRQAIAPRSKSIPDIMYILNTDATVRTLSDAFVTYLGLSVSDAAVGMPFAELMHETLLPADWAQGDTALLNGAASPEERVEAVSAPDGGRRYIRFVKLLLSGPDGQAAGLLCLGQDVTDARHAQKSYEREVQYLLHLRDDAYGSWLIDVDEWRLLQVRTPDGSHASIVRRDTVDGYIRAGKKGAAGDPEMLRSFDEMHPERLRAIFDSGRRQLDYEYRRVAAKDAGWVHLTLRLLLEPATGHLVMAAVMTDISKAKSRQSELLKAAEVDAMTGVLNHDATLGHMERFLTGEGSGGTHALIMVDRDNLKRINDTLGHQAGDDIIVQTARVLTNVFRDDDIVGRVGGDEFLVLMKNIGRASAARRKAAELLQSLQCICGPADSAMEVTGSIGVSIFNGDGKTLDKLYAEADTALYTAKAEGRNRYAMFSVGPDDYGEQRSAHDPLVDTVNLRTLLNSIDGGILILHTEPGMPLSPVFFSDSFLIMMGGLTQEEAFELYKNGLFSSIHPDDRERVRTEYAQALETCEPLRTTYRLLGKDGSYYWLSAGTNIIKNEDDKIDVYAVHTNIEKLMRQEEKLASDEQRFRVAFLQTSRMVFEVDFSSDVLTYYAKPGEHGADDGVVANMPDSLITSGFIDPKFTDVYQKFYADMCAGKAEDSLLIRCRYITSGEFGLASISYKTVFSADGRPLKAIGSYQELPNVARAQERMSRESFLMDSVRDDLLLTMKVNLTTDLIEDYSLQDGYAPNPMPGRSFSEFSNAVCTGKPYPEDSLLMQLNLTRSALLEAYAAGKSWTAIEFRREDGGEIRWTKAAVCLIEDPVQRELYGFFYISDVEKRRNMEVLLPVTVERDPVTHLYTRATLERLVNGMLRYVDPNGRRFGLALIRMLDMPALSARIGAENVDLERMYLCRFLSILLDNCCIVGRFHNDGILVFCPDVQSDQWMRELVENALARVKTLWQDNGAERHIRLVCGVSTEAARSAELSSMLSQAQTACDLSQSPDSEVVNSFEQYVESFRVEPASPGQSPFRTVAPEELARPLYGDERTAFTECMSAMLRADNFDASINATLGVLGRFYGAQRVYTLSLMDDSTSVSGLHEWVTAGRHSAMKKLAGVSLEKLPMFKRAISAARPVILDRAAAPTREDEPLDPAWCFIALPIIADNRTQGFLCIENPEHHKTDLALPQLVTPLILHERDRFGMSTAGMMLVGRDTLTGLPDQSAFESAMQSFNPDAYHTVGVLYVAIANLREINQNHSVSYGDDMLVFVAQTLTGVLKRAQVYRVSGSEFAVVCPNLSREAFEGLGLRTRSILQRRYPKCFRFGETWAAGGVSARKLMEDARSFANDGLEKRIIPTPKPSVDESSILTLRQWLNNNNFYIVLQPLVDMRADKLVGAEVLSRCRDENGKTILPSEFIHTFENAGAVRELDYFVMDKSLATLQSWLDRGVQPIPLSINISRQTLLSSTVLASTLAVSSRYDVPTNFMELEVTESIGNFDPDILRRIMDEMTQHGFRFTLDDLGSEYSSLRTLSDFRFDTVKLDKSLISNFLYNTMSRSVVESIVGVCAKNNIRCIAEGVESDLHAKGLMEVGCIYAQGYYYGKPMPPEDFFRKHLLHNQ